MMCYVLSKNFFIFTLENYFKKTLRNGEGRITPTHMSMIQCIKHKREGGVQKLTLIAY